MKLLFKQRLFSWLDSYDIYNEHGETAFTVEGKLTWGHKLEILDSAGRHLGTVKEEVPTIRPHFMLYLGEEYIGQIKKEFTFFKPSFTLDCRDWQISGDWLEWNYRVIDSQGRTVMTASKELFNLTDTYVMDIERDEDALLCLMIVLAIDSGGD